MLNKEILSKNANKIASIGLHMESAIAFEAYEYLFKPVLKKGNYSIDNLGADDEKSLKNAFEYAMRKLISKNGLVEISIDMVQEFTNKRKHKKLSKYGYDAGMHSLMSNLCKYIGEMYICFNMELNENELLNVFMVCVENSHLLDICLKIHMGEYNGHIDYMIKGKNNLKEV